MDLKEVKITKSFKVSVGVYRGRLTVFFTNARKCAVFKISKNDFDKFNEKIGVIQKHLEDFQSKS